MEQSKQEKVVELYKEKSMLYDDLNVLNTKDYNFLIGYKVPMSIYGCSKLSSVCYSFRAEIKKLTELHIKQRIEEIDEELEKL